MARAAVAVCVVAALVLGLTGRPDAEAEEGPLVIGIAVSPATLVIGSEGVWVTVHADIRYAAVELDDVTVYLNGVPVEVTKADNRGDLVAKFDIAKIKDIVAPPQAVLTLTGLTKDGVPFSGTDTVSVRKDQGR